MFDKIFNFLFDKVADKILELLSPLWNDVEILRIALLLLVIIILMLSYFAKKLHDENKNFKAKTDEKTLEHDKKLFEGSDSILAWESLDPMLNNLFNCWISSEQDSMLSEYLRYFKNSGNCFINKNLHSKFKEFYIALEKLYLFAATHFFPIGTLSIRKLYPELKNGDAKDREIYHQKLRELQALVKKVDLVYKKFRETIKNELFI